MSQCKKCHGNRLMGTLYGVLPCNACMGTGIEDCCSGSQECTPKGIQEVKLDATN